MPYQVKALLAQRAPSTTPQGRRIRKLFFSFMDRLDPANSIHTMLALRAAEMAVATEQARVRFLAGEDVADDVVRLDNTARRAADDLAPYQAEKPIETPWVSGWDAQRQE